MFEKDKSTILYNRQEFTLEEKLYESYLVMRKSMSELEGKKYSKSSEELCSEEFKQGFIAGVKIMSSLLIDI